MLFPLLQLVPKRNVLCPCLASSILLNFPGELLPIQHVSLSVLAFCVYSSLH